jgi:MFS family permease
VTSSEVARPRPARALLGVSAAAVALAAADTYVVVLALPDMMAGVGLGIEAFQRATPIVSGFLLGYVCTLPLVGRAADVVDRVRVLRWCLTIFIVGSVITALAVELWLLVGSRFLQGVGGGGLVPATVALVADRWPPERRGLPLGVIGGVQEAGAVLGPVAGGLVLAVADWRAIFWLAAAAAAAMWVLIGALEGRDPAAAPAPRAARSGPSRRLTRVSTLVAGAALAVALWSPPALVSEVTVGALLAPMVGTSRVASPLGIVALAGLALAASLAIPRWSWVTREIDLVGAALLAVALGSLVLTFSVADAQREVVGPVGWTLLPVGALASALAYWRHRVARTPLIPRGVLRGRAGWATVVSLFVGAALVTVVVDIPLLARLTWTSSQAAAALVLVRFLAAMPVGAVFGGWLLRRLPPGAVAAAGLALAAGALAVATTWGVSTLRDAPVSVTLVLVSCGLGFGLALAPVNAAALEDGSAASHGVVSSLVVVGRMVGMIVGLALLTTIGLRRYYDAVRALPDQSDVPALLATAVVQVQTVFAGGAVCAALGALVALGRLGCRRP